MLRTAGIGVPLGILSASPQECRRAALSISGRVVLKAQIWLTDRKNKGGVLFADNPEQAEQAAFEIFSRFPHCKVLVERAVDFIREVYVGIIVDDRRRQLVLLASAEGGTGIEGRESLVHRLYLNDNRCPAIEELKAFSERASLPIQIAQIGAIVCRLAKQTEARSLEINPLVETRLGEFLALDCRISVDDYAVYRHPELGIEIAREFSSFPGDLDRIAWNVERDDYRGTFYFAELERAQGVAVGFHGCGGGGAMAGMDALKRFDLVPANFCDTSGNPPASKIYRAAKIILSQPGLQGYFLCGSGFASQEQIHIARGLIKAFREEKVQMPVVLRLGGNGEDEAKKKMARYALDASAPVETYQKIHSAEFCAERLASQIKAAQNVEPESPAATKPAYISPYSFATRTGTITYDHAVCAGCASKACIHECVPQILTLQDGLPRLAIAESDAARGRCTECLACEVECHDQGAGGAFIDLPIPGLAEYREKYGHSR